MPNQTFIIPAAFDPTRSMLGRWIHARSVDKRQAESTYVVAAVLSVLAVIMIHFLGWSIVGSRAAGAEIPLAAAEAILVVVYAAVAFAGRAPAVAVRAEPTTLRISRPGAGDLAVSYDDVERVERIDSRTFHRHYRKYAETRAFVNRMHDELLLLRWRGTPIVLGLRDDDLESVEHLLRSRSSADRASSHVDAA